MAKFEKFNTKQVNNFQIILIFFVNTILTTCNKLGYSIGSVQGNLVLPVHVTVP